MTKRLYHTFSWLVISILLSWFCSCANRGIGPQGGPRDTIPPMVVQETPLNGSVLCQPKKIEVAFNEYIQLDNIQQNLLISPPQQVSPNINAVGKKLTVEFQESLLDSTTYTLDFGSSICDFHEKNPLTSYLFSFATGTYIDSLSIGGRVIDAETLNPYANLLVGIHSNLSDTALSSLPFTRVARTDSIGRFSIHNVRSGSYRLYALHDVSRDYIYQPGESLAFLDSVLVPQCHTTLYRDTLYRDSMLLDSLHPDSLIHLIDTIIIRRENHYSPSDVVLWHFCEQKTAHYFQRALREEPHRFTLLFSAPQDSLPYIEALPLSLIDSTFNDSLWHNPQPYFSLQANPTRDTLVYWLTDSIAISQDTILLRMTYTKTDSLFQMHPVTDTIKVIYRAPRMSEKALAAQRQAAAARRLQIITNTRSDFDIFDTIRLSSAYPLSKVDPHAIHLFRMVDTIRTSQPFSLQCLDSAQMHFHILTSLQPGAQYELRIDSAAFCDIYGVVNLQQIAKCKLKRKEDYASLRILVPDSSNAPIRVQLLSEQEKVLRDQPLLHGATDFTYLAAQSYYLRLYIDLNGDAHWTTGDWQSHRQPEPVYYFPSKLKLRSNWDFEETFDYLSLPQIESKPQEIRKDAGQKK